ncbi:hypothetical protein ACYPKM_02385 [Pseudomonas aeruginosa]
MELTASEVKPLTREEVERIKRDWVADGDWPLEDTPGAEAYREELAAFAKDHLAQVDLKYTQEIAKKAADLGCPGNLALAQYVRSLEDRLQRFEDRLDRLEG